MSASSAASPKSEYDSQLAKRLLIEFPSVLDSYSAEKGATVAGVARGKAPLSDR